MLFSAEKRLIVIELANSASTSRTTNSRIVHQSNSSKAVSAITHPAAAAAATTPCHPAVAAANSNGAQVQLHVNAICEEDEDEALRDDSSLDRRDSWDEVRIEERVDVVADVKQIPKALQVSTLVTVHTVKTASGYKVTSVWNPESWITFMSNTGFFDW